MRFICSVCGDEHDLDELSFGADAPLQWWLLSDVERAESMLAGEQCETKAEGRRGYYLRACLDIPIRGSKRTFTWGVWCSLSEASYREVLNHWDDPARTSLGPYFGWLCTTLPGYPDTAFLKTMVHQRAVGQRPSVELEPSDHPLAIEQREGIDEPRLRRLVVELLHGVDR